MTALGQHRSVDSSGCDHSLRFGYSREDCDKIAFAMFNNASLLYLWKAPSGKLMNMKMALSPYLMRFLRRTLISHGQYKRFN